MIVVAICEAFGWTYDEYLDQPTHFIDLIKDKMKVDGERAAKQGKN